MASVRVVTGLCPIPNHPRKFEEYTELGDRLVTGLRDAGYPVDVHFTLPENLELLKVVSPGTNVLVADNPIKNTLEYHATQHQKFIWMYDTYKSVEMHPDSYIWIDAGILHVPGVTLDVITEYLAAQKPATEITIPGCWSRDRSELVLAHGGLSWRFCGGLFKVPSSLVAKFAVQAFTTAMGYIHANEYVEWEVNTLARLEQLNLLPIRWYQADHNETMFTADPDVVAARAAATPTEIP